MVEVRVLRERKPKVTVHIWSAEDMCDITFDADEVEIDSPSWATLNEEIKKAAAHAGVPIKYGLKFWRVYGTTYDKAKMIVEMLKKVADVEVIDHARGITVFSGDLRARELGEIKDKYFLDIVEKSRKEWSEKLRRMKPYELQVWVEAFADLMKINMLEINVYRKSKGLPQVNFTGAGLEEVLAVRLNTKPTDEEEDTARLLGRWLAFREYVERMKNKSSKFRKLYQEMKERGLLGLEKGKPLSDLVTSIGLH